MLQQEKGCTVLFMWRIGLNLLEYGMSCVNYPVSIVFIYQREARPMKRIKIKLLVLLLLAGLAGQSQEEFIEPVSRLLTRFRVTQLTGGVVILNAQLDDFPDTLNFILDTGSSGISLDSSTVAYFKLHPEASDRTIRGIAGIKKVGFLYNRKLKFPGLTVDSLNFHVNDYSVLTSVYGEQIDGIIGYSLLSRYIIKINYDSLYMDICSRGSVTLSKGRIFVKTYYQHLARPVCKDKR